MAFYRSELEVPVNKTSSQLRSDADNCNSQNNHTFNPSLENWRDKVKSQFQNDLDASNCFQDNFVQSDAMKSYFNKSNIKDIDCFKSFEMFQQLQSKIAQGIDGNMHFAAKFDVKNVNPDSVKVFVKEGSLVISVEQKETISKLLSSSKEYTRKFNLPPNIIIDTISCTLSSDSILCLDGVLECTPNKRRTTSPNFSNTSIRDSSSSIGSSSLSQSRQEQRYKINVTIGCGYDPQDINIRTRDDKLFINARHEEKSESRTNYREFSKEVTLPNNVDSLSLSAIFNNGILYLEAPYVDR